MIIKNILKGMIKKPFAMIGIISMVLLAGCLYVSLGYTLFVTEDTVNQFVVDYKQEDFTFQMNSSLSDEEKEVYQVDYIYQLSNSDQKTLINNRINLLENEYQINIEVREYKQLSIHELDKEITIRLFTDSKDINLTYVEKGRLPEANNEIALSMVFAENNDLQLGDNFKINQSTYKIVGFIYLVDYIYPQLTNELFALDTSKQALGMLNEDSFSNLEAPKDVDYVGKFLKGNYTEEEIKEIDHFYMVNLVDAKTNFRTGAVYGEIKADRAMINALSVIILFLAVIIIGIVVNKSIQMEKNQIGVLKSLGYSHLRLLSAYMIYPIIASVIGSGLGYLTGYLLAHPLIDMFRSMFQMPMHHIQFNFMIFIYSIVLPIIVLNIFSFIIIYFLVRKKPLELMRVKVSQKVNFIIKRIPQLFKKKSFNTRFKYSIALRGLGKLFITFIGVVVSSIYLIFALSFSQSIDSIIHVSSVQANYQYQVIYEYPTQTEKSESDDRFMIMPSEIIIGDDEVKVQLMGIDDKLNKYQLKNEAGKNLVPILYDNEDGVVVSSMLSTIHNIDLNDSITLHLLSEYGSENEIEMKVVGIMENYTTPYVFMSIKSLNEQYGLDDNWYNGLWTDQKITQNVKSIVHKEEMIDSIEEMMSLFKAFIYVMVVISVILAFIVLIIISIFNIQDNFKTISFLKVMGYKDKEITTMVLNIYLPIILVGYLVSIPITIMSIRSMMVTISSELNFAFPIQLSTSYIIFGFIIIFLTYYLSLRIARRRLNKIPLQEALKINE